MPIGKHFMRSLCLRRAALAASLVLLPNLLRAQSSPGSSTTVTGTSDWDQWKKNCSNRDEGKAKGKLKDKLIACGTSTFRSRPFHFVAQSIVPGSGVGGGGQYAHDLNRGTWQRQLTAKGVMTIRRFWLADLELTQQHSISADWNKSGESLGWNFYAHNRDMPIMPFYGLGPNTILSNAVQFSQRDTVAGMSLTAPFPELSWLSVGGKVEGLWPQVGSVSTPISIQTKYTELTAPGLVAQPPFVHEQIFLLPQKRFLERFEIRYNTSYNLYQDTDTGHYSFWRFDANLEHRFYPEKKKHGGAIVQNFFYARWRYSASDTSSGNAIPFYLQETLGGTDIDGGSSLRAFKDYRFRAPNLMMVQAGYDRKLCNGCTPCKAGLIRTVCEHLGLLLDYDAGKVMFSKSDMKFSDLRQSYGGGIAVYLGKDVIFSMAVALGGGEGTHPYFGVGNLPQ